MMNTEEFAAAVLQWGDQLILVFADMSERIGKAVLPIIGLLDEWVPNTIAEPRHTPRPQYYPYRNKFQQQNVIHSARHYHRRGISS